MSKNKKQIARELKSPDKFQTEMIGMLEWFTAHKTIILTIGVPVAVAAISFFAWQEYSKTQTDLRLAELGKIAVAYEAEDEKAIAARTALEGKLAKLQEKNTKKGKSVKEIADLAKQIADIKPNHTATTAQYQKLFDKYSDKPEGWAAGMTAAGEFLNAKNFKEAKSILEKIIKKSVSYPFYQIQGRLVLISILEELGEYDVALKEANVLSEIVDKDLKPRALLVKGRIQLLKKSNADAVATFKQLIEKHGSSPEAQKARTMQSVLIKGG